MNNNLNWQTGDADSRTLALPPGKSKVIAFPLTDMAKHRLFCRM